MCDASAAVSIGNNRFIVANDEDNLFRIYDLNRPDNFPVYEMDVSGHLGGAERYPQLCNGHDVNIPSAIPPCEVTFRSPISTPNLP